MENNNSPLTGTPPGSALFERLGRWLIRDFERPAAQAVRVRHGYAAGWVSILVLLALFAVRLALGLASGAISVVAVSFTLLSDLLASVVLVVSFRVSARPATARNPFGHGRMEQVAPLLISFVLFFLGIEVARESAHALTGTHATHYWWLMPWIVLATAVVKRVLGRFVLFLGRRVGSHAIEETAAHLAIEGAYSLAVVAGLFLGHYLDLPWLDGTIGLAGALAILYLSFRNARHALEPLLGKAPSEELLREVRDLARGVAGIEGVHEIVVHDYGQLRVLSLHAEISESLPAAESHGIAEQLEGALRRGLGGDVVVHTDPLMERTPAVEALEARFRELVAQVPEITGYTDFRIVAHSREKIILVADIEAGRELSDADRDAALARLRELAPAAFPELAYPVFNLTQRFSY